VSFMTAPVTGPWNFAQYLLNRTVLHFGSVAGGAIIHGTTRSNLYLWFLESADCPDRIVFDGRITKSPGIVMIPPASHFTFACTGPARWISLLVELTNGGFNKSLTPIETIKIMMAPQVAELVRLVDAATAARKVINLGGLERLQATETSLLGLLDTILSNSVADGRYFDERSDESIFADQIGLTRVTPKQTTSLLRNVQAEIVGHGRLPNLQTERTMPRSP